MKEFESVIILNAKLSKEEVNKVTEKVEKELRK